jgi:hypothetical protein
VPLGGEGLPLLHAVFVFADFDDLTVFELHLAPFENLKMIHRRVFSFCER